MPDAASVEEIPVSGAEVIIEPRLRLVAGRPDNRDSSRFHVFRTLVVMDFYLPKQCDLGFTVQEIATWGWVLNPDLPLFQTPGNPGLPAYAQVMAKITEKDGNWMRAEGHVLYEKVAGKTFSRARLTRLGRYHATTELAIEIPGVCMVQRLWDEARARLSLGMMPELDVSA